MNLGDKNVITARGSVERAGGKVIYDLGIINSLSIEIDPNKIDALEKLGYELKETKGISPPTHFRG